MLRIVRFFPLILHNIRPISFGKVVENAKKTKSKLPCKLIKYTVFK